MSENVTNYDPFDPFQTAKVEREQMKADQESKNNYSGGGNREQIKYLGLNPDIKHVFRIISNPVLFSKSSEKEAKVLLTSKFLKDTSKGMCHINFPYVIQKGKIKPDPEWFMTRVIDTVFGGLWVPLTEADVDGDKIVKGADGRIFNAKSKFKSTNKFEYTNTNTPSFKRLKNNKLENATIVSDVNPAPKVLLNVIDRRDDWCKINMHTKVLATKSNVVDIPQENGSVKTNDYTEPGISYSMYEQVLDHFVNFRRDWFIDCVIRRFKNSSGWTFEIQDAQDFKKLPEDIQKVITEEPLTEEERSYKTYDLDKLSQVSTYSKIKKNLEKLIRQVDIDYNTRFLDELVQLCEKERAMFKEKYGNEEGEEQVQETETVEVKAVQASVQKEESVVEPIRPTRTATPVVTDLQTELSAYLPNWKTLDAEDVKFMLRDVEKVTDKGLVYKAGVTTLACDNKECTFPGTTVRTQLPDKVYNCPVCSKKFN